MIFDQLQGVSTKKTMNGISNQSEMNSGISGWDNPWMQYSFYSRFLLTPQGWF